MKYGITADDMTELSSDQLLAFFWASEEWHRLLGFKSNKRVNMMISKHKMNEKSQKRVKKRVREQEEDQTRDDLMK